MRILRPVMLILMPDARCLDGFIGTRSPNFRTIRGHQVAGGPRLVAPTWPCDQKDPAWAGSVSEPSSVSCYERWGYQPTVPAPETPSSFLTKVFPAAALFAETPKA